MQKINYLIIDKTGTLTERKTVHSIRLRFLNLQLAASLNSNSNHPLAEPLLNMLWKTGGITAHTSFENVTVKGERNCRRSHDLCRYYQIHVR
ncbi:MAG: HAD family hydrolase [Crocinitomicaceae bacterium]